MTPESHLLGGPAGRDGADSGCAGQGSIELTGRERGSADVTMTGLGQTRATRTLRTSDEIPKYQDTSKVRKIRVLILCGSSKIAPNTESCAVSQMAC